MPGYIAWQKISESENFITLGSEAEYLTCSLIGLMGDMVMVRGHFYFSGHRGPIPFPALCALCLRAQHGSPPVVQRHAIGLIGVSKWPVEYD